ncbi:hypothetical protein PSA01_43720 [Pseudonocardia saturnea]|uniref:Uncharacterized protein n=1 Tax=Pseudonocardia saturnea TaxID=33909 RepID=A0ABQ0S3I7_9PSEU|nr:hypothetical protein Pdca_50670 [Pseudonocardia autotrophica]GEC27343.1 hypothetical protein PSA01_43720 [Pseudonocardia saturnea]
MKTRSPPFQFARKPPSKLGAAPSGFDSAIEVKASLSLMFLRRTSVNRPATAPMAKGIRQPHSYIAPSGSALLSRAPSADAMTIAAVPEVKIELAQSPRRCCGATSAT